MEDGDACDFPEQETRKFLSTDASSDSVAANFFRRFSLPATGRTGHSAPQLSLRVSLGKMRRRRTEKEMEGGGKQEETEEI